MLPGTSAEVFYSTLPPEAVSAEAGEKEQGSVLNLVNSWKWKKGGFAALAFICVAALVIGLGIGLKKRSENPSSSPPTVRFEVLIPGSLLLLMKNKPYHTALVSEWLFNTTNFQRFISCGYHYGERRPTSVFPGF